MDINKIVGFVNDKLAGETLMYGQLLVFLDSTIDDINASLNSNYPAFSELSGITEYSYFPDKYIRTVVIPGAASKFYTTDEEGAQVATMYDIEYKNNLFHMVRDFSHLVPEEYRCDEQGYMIDYNSKCHNCYDTHIRRWFE